MEKIRDYKKIADWLHTSGQPTANELSKLSEFGIKHVVNLALPSSDNAVENEAAIVGEQGINYLNIPVDFKSPETSQFSIFCAYLNQVKGENILVHCAYNLRVSAFVFLYRVIHLGVSKSEAEIKLHELWVPHNEWESFVTGVLENA